MFFLLGGNLSVKIPNFVFPKTIDNIGNYVTSLSKLTRWMGEKAAEMGVDIITGTPGSDIIYG